MIVSHPFGVLENRYLKYNNNEITMYHGSMRSVKISFLVIVRILLFEVRVSSGFTLFSR